MRIPSCIQYSMEKMGGDLVKILHTRKQILGLYMLGFLSGIFYANLTGNQLGLNWGIFSEYFLERYKELEIIVSEYIFYIFRVRMIPFLVLLGLAFTNLGKVSVISFILCTGFSSGVLLSMSVLYMGVKGVILCVIGILPQFLCYIPACLVVLWYSYTYPKGQWNLQKSIFTGVMLVLGVILEVYVNPIFVKMFIGIL